MAARTRASSPSPTSVRVQSDRAIRRNLLISTGGGGGAGFGGGHAGVGVMRPLSTSWRSCKRIVWAADPVRPRRDTPPSSDAVVLDAAHFDFGTDAAPSVTLTEQAYD